MSAAYYALFHALAFSGASALAGSDRNSPSWQQAYRALEHGHARNQCNDRPGMGIFSAEIQVFGYNFVYMQAQRQQADYSPSATFSRGRVIQLIDETENAVTAFKNASTADRRAFAIHVLMRRRRE